MGILAYDHVHALTGTSNPWSLQGTLPSEQSTGSPAATALVRQWLNTCIKTHAQCQPPTDDDPVLPTRVLDVGPGPSSTVTLQETNGHRGRCICLSYCWGLANFTTTRETLKAHMLGIEVEPLPQTFRDAIRIARALGMRYLWIDALCIIQRDIDLADWKLESGRMAAYYRNSHLTLAVAWADSVHGGCFATPDPTGAVQVGTIRMREMHYFPNQALQKRSTNFPLLTRAWTYQERMLAPRVVYFGQNELLWDCVENRTCECGEATYLLDEVEKTRLFTEMVFKAQPDQDNSCMSLVNVAMSNFRSRAYS